MATRPSPQQAPSLPKLVFPPPGKTFPSTYRQEMAPQMRADQIEVVHKVRQTPGFTLAEYGDLHPDKENFPGYKLNLIRYTDDGKGVIYVYVKYRGDLVQDARTDVAQIATITQSIVAEGAAPPTLSALIIKYEDKNLANGEMLREVWTVPNVFPATKSSVEIPDLFPVEMRAFIPTQTEAITTAGNIDDPPTLAAGDLSVTDEQLTEFTKRTTRIFRTVEVPVTLVNYALTEEYGGGVVSITRTVDTNGTMTVDQGLLILSSKVTNLGNGFDLKETVSLDDTEWPELLGDHTDAVYGIVAAISKKVVPAGTTWPGVAVSISSPYVEIEPHDKWRSIQIVSKVDCDTLPDDVTYPAVHRIDLPPLLLGVVANWGFTGGSSREIEYSRVTNSSGTAVGAIARAQVSVSDGVLGSIEVLVKHGYQGPALASITRKFFCGPPDPSIVPAITKIIPVTGTASLIGKHVTFTQMRGSGIVDSGGTHFSSAKDGNNGEMRTQTMTFGPVLSGAIDTTTTQGGTGSSANTGSTSPDINGEVYSAIAILAPGSVAGTLHVHVPASTPGAINSGDVLVVEAIPEEWRFGIWVYHIISVKVP